MPEEARLDALSLAHTPDAVPAHGAGDPPGEADATQVRGAHWTEERIARLKSMWEDGASLKEIALAIGNLTRNQVVGKVHRLGLQKRPSPLLPAARSWYMAKEQASRSEAAKPEPFPIAELLALPASRIVLGLPPLPQPAPRPAPRPVQVQVPSAASPRTGASASDAAARTVRPAREPGREAPAVRARAPEPVMALAYVPPTQGHGCSAAVQGLTMGACKWPIGDPRDADFHFCCAPMKGAQHSMA